MADSILKVLENVRSDPEPSHSVNPCTDADLFTKVLTSDDVDLTGRHPRLRIDCYDAVTLTGNLKLLELPAASGSFSKIMHVVEDDGLAYDMKLSDYLKPFDWAGYSICHNWGLFVQRRELRAGDRIFFFRNLHNTDTDVLCFNVKFVRMLSPRAAELIYTQEGVKPRTDADVFTKVLTSDDVNLTRLQPQVRIDCFDAVTLTGNLKLLELPAASESFSRIMHVVDEDGLAYVMKLSDYLRPLEYSICRDWGYFVQRHELEAGDRIFFFRNLHNTDFLDFEVKFVRMPSLPLVDLVNTPDGFLRKKRKWHQE